MFQFITFNSWKTDSLNLPYYAISFWKKKEDYYSLFKKIHMHGIKKQSLIAVSYKWSFLKSKIIYYFFTVLAVSHSETFYIRLLLWLPSLCMLFSFYIYCLIRLLIILHASKRERYETCCPRCYGDCQHLETFWFHVQWHYQVLLIVVLIQCCCCCCCCLNLF